MTLLFPIYGKGRDLFIPKLTWPLVLIAYFVLYSRTPGWSSKSLALDLLICGFCRLGDRGSWKQRCPGR